LSEQKVKQLMVAFGANQTFGDLSPSELILQSSRAVSSLLDAKVRLSSLYQTPCFPAGSGPDYINAAACMTLRNAAAPDHVLAQLHAVEARFGRIRSERWAARTLDIDLIAADDAVLPDAATQAHWRNLPLAEQMRQTPDRLILPHPRLQDRAFVLVPLTEVAPNWQHPALGLTVAEMLAALPAADRAEVVRLNPAASE
jgi:2-amino-4-hydroxy-6-hydroxymethyldihydropteridine diphosphokinase